MITAKVQVIGNIGSIEAQYTPQGKYIVKGSVAVNIGYGDNKRTNWYRFVIWEKTAELFDKFCQKGTRVLLEGTQEIKEWNDKEGVKHTQVEITVKEFEVLRNGKSRDESESTEDQPDFMAE